jgi:hypothetical protein
MRRREIGPELSIDPPKSACYLSVLPTVLDKNVASSIPADRDHHRFEPEAALTGRVSAEIMSEHEEQSKGFKVTDRRSFTREGDRIAQHEEEREMVEARSTAAPDARLPAESAGRLEPLFLDLLSLLATQASLALGSPHPMTGEAHDDLEMARAMISMIEVLRTKTKGNLARDEERALDDILYQLRMEFTKQAKAAKS